MQPTFYDPCSLVVLEALAAGLPVVTSRFNGVSELLTQGREGYVICDPGDHYELAEALLPMFNPARRVAMGQAARELAMHHPLERNCREILDVYQEIVSPPAVLCRLIRGVSTARKDTRFASEAANRPHVASTSWITRPCTSVSRRSMPL